MSAGVEKTVYYFEKKGPVNTDRTIEIALAGCEERSITKIVVASSRGDTALKLRAAANASLEIIAVTYGAGSRFRDDVEQFNQNANALVEKGIRIVRGIHALSATERAFENKYQNKFIPLNIVADTLRMFCHGVKVCVEVAVMGLAVAGLGLLPLADWMTLSFRPVWLVATSAVGCASSPATSSSTNQGGVSGASP